MFDIAQNMYFNVFRDIIMSKPLQSMVLHDIIKKSLILLEIGENKK